MFSSEKELVEMIKAAIVNDSLGNININRMQILEEVDLGFGIADIVVAEVILPTNRHLSLDYFDLTVYSIVQQKGSAAISDILQITRASNSTIKQSITKLIQENYVLEIEESYQIANQYYTYTSKTIAIEAKIRNWKRALYQAYRYKWFAWASYVILDKKNIKSAQKALDSFRKMNVGLISIDISGKLEVCLEAKYEKPIDTKMDMLLSEHILELSEIYE